MPLASIVSGSSNCVSDPRCDSRSVPSKARCQREAVGAFAADDVLHVDRLALPHQRAVEHGVEDVVALRLAVGQVEIVRADALAPFGQVEAEIARPCARRSSADARSIPRSQIAIGFGLGQAARARTARPLASVAPRASNAPVQLSVTRTSAPATGLPVSSCVTQARLRSRPHLKCTAHVGDERGGRDIARRIAAEQRPAERRAGQFDDIESGLGQRDADDLEILALAGQRDLAAPRPARPSGSARDPVLLIVDGLARRASPRRRRNRRRRRPCAAISRSRRRRRRPAASGRRCRGCGPQAPARRCGR